MEITKVKYWKKTVQQDVVDHVSIAYSENGKEVKVHEFGSNSQAAPDFYFNMESFSKCVAAACNLPDELIDKIAVREISIKKSEDKEGTDNTTYSIIASLKAGTTTAELRCTVQHKYLPEGFEDAMVKITNEAEEYIGGKRAQVSLPTPDSNMGDEPSDPDDTISSEGGEE